MWDLSEAEDVSFESSLIPKGTVVMCKVSVGDKRQSQRDTQNWYYDITLEALDAKYAGAKFFDNWGVQGSENFMRMGKTKARYALETTRNTHESNNPDAYKINSLKDLDNTRVVVKVDVEPHTNKEGRKMYINKASAYGTPRKDSSNYKFFEAWESGEQPWQDLSELPPLQQDAQPRNGVSAGYASNVAGSYAAPPAGYPAMSDDIPFAPCF